MAERRRTRGQDGFSEGRNFRPPRQSHARQQEGSERTPRQQQPPMSDSRQATGSRRQSEYFDGGQGRGRGSMYGPPRQQRESYSTGEDQDRPPRDNRESYGGRPSRGFGPSGRGQQDRGSYRGDDRSRRQTVTTFNMSQVQSSLNETESRSRRSENFSSRGRPRGSGYPRTSDRAVTAPASSMHFDRCLPLV